MTALFAVAVVVGVLCAVAAPAVWWLHVEGADLRSLRRWQRVWRRWERWSE